MKRKTKQRVQRILSWVMILVGAYYEIGLEIGVLGKGEPIEVYRMSALALLFTGIAGLFAVDSGD